MITSGTARDANYAKSLVLWSRKTARWILGVPCAMICLAALFVLTLAGTFYQIDAGLLAARERFFSSWLVLLGGVFPFPGAQLVFLILAVNLLGSTLIMWRLRALRLGVGLIHGGLLILLAGGAWTQWTSESGVIQLGIGEATEEVQPVEGLAPESAFPLGARLELISAKREFWPNSTIPRHFESLVRFEQAGVSRDVRISMNRPLRFGSTTIYQSRFETPMEGPPRTVLSVMRNPAQPIPYVGTLCTVLGMLLHFGGLLLADSARSRVPVKQNRNRVGLPGFIVATLALVFMTGLYAPPKTGFGHTLVQWQGRVMPVATCARLCLTQLSGRSSIELDEQKLGAVEWLQRVLFDPPSTREDPVFLIQHPEIVTALELENVKGREGRQRVSFEALSPQLAELNAFALRASQIPVDERNPIHRELIRLSNNTHLYHDLTLAFSGKAEGLTHSFAVRPMQEGPWAAPGPLEEDLFVGYHSREEAVGLYPAAIASLQNRQRKALETFELDHVIRRTKLESRFEAFNPFGKAKWFYGLGGALLLIGLLVGRRVFTRGALAFLILGFLVHGLGLVIRMVMMGRPPVTNLYATFLFVGWVMVSLSFLLHRRFRNPALLLTASISGLLLLQVAQRWQAEGDSLGSLVAVLDSNFWLSTHVITITIGYAGVALAGMIGHLVLLRLVRGVSSVDIKPLLRSMHSTLCFGLFFAFLGTFLGGMWADQSWGRFWGWDPKENGALLIILWSAILFHGRYARLLGPAGYATGCVLGTIIVLFAWLGTNLLGVGLHAYGFTSGVGLWMAAVMVSEFIFANGCLLLLGWRNRVGPLQVLRSIS